MLYLNRKYGPELAALLIANGFTINPQGEGELVYDEVAIQAIIDTFPAPAVDISRRQFYHLLASTGLDLAIDTALNILRESDIAKYAECKSQLDGGLVFFWNKCWSLYSQLKPLLVQADSTLDFTEAELREKWLESSLT